MRDISGREDLSRQIWSLLAFTLWFDRDAREPASAGTSVQLVDPPGIGAIDLGQALTVFGIVAVGNVINLSDGVDGGSPEVNPTQPPPQPARAPGRRGS